mgnify:CR=1 FL=1
MGMNMGYDLPPAHAPASDDAASLPAYRYIGARVVELGAGPGLVGIMLAKMGAKVGAGWSVWAVRMKPTRLERDADTGSGEEWWLWRFCTLEEHGWWRTYMEAHNGSASLPRVSQGCHACHGCCCRCT